MQITIEAHNGDVSVLEVKKIGAGLFAKVYEVVSGEHAGMIVKLFDEKYQFIHEVYAVVQYNYSDCVHTPFSEKLGYTKVKGVWYNVLLQKKYKKFTLGNANEDSKKAFRLITGAWGKILWSKGVHHDYIANAFDEDGVCVVEGFEGQVLPEKIWREFNYLLGWASDYGSEIAFEFQKRNLGLDEDGNIVFLDVFFNEEDAVKIRKGVK